MAEQHAGYDFQAVEANDILAERQQGWDRFTQFTVWSVVSIAAVLILLAIFVA
jgi:hypothetical protein